MSLPGSRIRRHLQLSRAHAAGCRPPSRCGFTLIELLAATVLATLLMAVLAGVLSQVARQRRLVEEIAPAQAWQGALSRQLRWDLEHSRKIAGDDHVLRLVGYAGRDFRTAAPTHRPTEVIYEIIQQQQRTWLMRTEMHLDAARLHAARSELVAAGIERLEVWRTLPGGQSRRISASLQPTPALLQIRFAAQQDAQFGFQRQYVLE